MSNILVIGAGRSSSALIKYLLGHSNEHNWKVTVGDMDPELAKHKINNHPNGKAIAFDIKNEELRKKEIQQADLVISMLPAFMHMEVAQDCLKYKKNMVTASYVSKEMAAMDAEVKKAGLLFLNEIGLDPGIDHLSAMKIIDEIRHEGGEIVSFKSYCGGLVAPQSNDNPWGYKFSWNPRNVILAGQSTAQYLQNGRLKFVPYHKIFAHPESVKVKGHGAFDAYPNRDSLSYIKPYGIEKAKTVIRGTLRQHNYCRAWNILVQLGMADDSFVIEDAGKLSYKQFTTSFLPQEYNTLKDYIIKELNYKKAADIIKMIDWLDLMSNKKIALKRGTPAQILQDLLEKKWMLKKKDLDMIVMQHQFEYKVKGKLKKLNSSLVLIGEDQTYTAMAKTVGLPLAIAAKMILLGKIKLTGVQIPLDKKIYLPVLEELEKYGIRFVEGQE